MQTVLGQIGSLGSFSMFYELLNVSLCVFVDGLGQKSCLGTLNNPT